MPRIGSTFGRYRIDGPLGEGGMAAVFRAFETDLDRHVALKILPSEFATDKTFGERFNREAKMVAKLEHPNIVPIFAYGIHEGAPWMAMRLIAGGNLAALAGGRPMPPRRAVAIIEGVANALDYAHAKGVIHRDVKPQNILLDESGRVYLVDFGVARMKEGAQRLTQAGLVAGTPHYMAPEQASGGELDSRVDIYALGVVAYELLTGRTPFQADEPMDVLLKHISDPVPVPVRGSVPEGMIEPLMTCLAKRPDDRWPTARAFADALLAGLEASGESEARDDYAPTMAMERPDFSDMSEPKERTYEPTVLSQRPPVGKPPAGEQRTYEPTVFSPRPVGSAAKAPETPRYEPTVLAPRVGSPGATNAKVTKPAAGSSSSGAGSGLKIAAAVLVGFGLLLGVGVLGGYLWWTGRNKAADEQAPPVDLAQARPVDLAVPPPPPAASEAAAQPAAEPAAEPANTPATEAPQAGEQPGAAPPGAAPPAARPSAPAARPSPQAPARPPARPAATPRSEATAVPNPTSPPKAEPSETAGAAKEEAPREAVPEASRNWTNAPEADRTVPVQFERSIDLGVRVAGVPVDRVYLTAKDTRAGIKKLFKKSTDKKRLEAEFLLNCPKDGSRPKLRFEVELQKAEGSVIERLSENKNCEGHVRLSRDVATSILDEARKVRIRVRSGS